MQRSLLSALIFSLMTLTSAYAAEDNQSASPSVRNDKPLYFLVGAGLTFGGDTLITAYYTDGSTENITAGGMLLFYGGLEYRLNDVLSVQGNMGYHVNDTRAASNASVTFSRIPLDLLAYYHVNNKFRAGGGARMINSAKLKGSGDASNINASFDNTVGVVIEGEYLFTPKLGIKVRHVRERYQESGNPVSIDGSHFGVLANLYF